MGTLADVVKDEIAALPHLQVCELASTRKSARPLQVTRGDLLAKPTPLWLW